MTEELHYPNEADAELEEALRRGGYDPAPFEAAGPRFIIQPLSAIAPKLSGAWLIKGLLLSEGLAVAYGPPGCGKTFLVLDAILHIAAGLPWAGQRVTQAGVVYVASEGGEGFKRRIAAIKADRGYRNDLPFGLITVAPNLGSGEGDASALVQDIQQQCAVMGWRPGVVVLDTVARSVVGIDENSSKDMGVFIANADVVAKRLGATVIGVHHTGKNIDAGMRGSNALHGATFTEWEIRSDDGGRSVKIEKLKDGRDGLRWTFALRSVELGNDEDGDPVTSCVVDILSRPEQPGTNSATARPLKGQKAEFIKAVRMAIDDMGETVPAGEHTPSNVKGIRKDKLSLYTDRLGFTDPAKPDSRKAIINRHIRELAGDKVIAQWGEWVWLARNK